MLDFGVDIDAAKFLHDYFIENPYLGLESGIDSRSSLRAKSIEERACDAKALKDDFGVFVLNGLFEELCDLCSRVRKSGLRLLIKSLRAEHSSQDSKRANGRLETRPVVDSLLELRPHIVEVFIKLELHEQRVR